MGWVKIFTSWGEGSGATAGEAYDALTEGMREAHEAGDMYGYEELRAMREGVVEYALRTEEHEASYSMWQRIFGGVPEE